MRGNYAIFVDGLTEALSDYETLPNEIRLNIVRAVNTTLRNGRTLAARRIRDQVNLPARQLGPGAGRLTVSRKANKTKLEGAIRARARATSLARYVSNKPRRGQPVRVEVQPGKARYLRNAFLVKLPAGSDTDTRFNSGLAMRLRPGERLRNKKNTIKLANNLYLLYGPSVDQVFLDSQNDGVAEEIQPTVLEGLEDEFFRLLEV